MEAVLLPRYSKSAPPAPLFTALLPRRIEVAGWGCAAGTTVPNGAEAKSPNPLKLRLLATPDPVSRLGFSDSKRDDHFTRCLPRLHHLAIPVRPTNVQLQKLALTCVESSAEDIPPEGSSVLRRHPKEISDTCSKRAPQRRGRRTIAAVLVVELALLLPFANPAAAADLRQQTIDAFNRYAQLTETQIDSGLARRQPFLWIESLPESRREAAYAQLRDGQVVIDRLETLDGGRHIEVRGGMIRHWIGTIFIPGATLAQTLALEQDYDHQQQYFRPDVLRSKIDRRDGNDFVIELRFYKKKVITTVIDTTHEVHYQPVDATHEWSRSHTTRIQEVDDAGKPGEKLEPEGHDRGFLWRMNTYWRFEEKDGGTYVECQSISLTRDIPAMLAWMIGSYVESVPRESLTFTLATTRSAVLQRIGAQATH